MGVSTYIYIHIRATNTQTHLLLYINGRFWKLVCTSMCVYVGTWNKTLDEGARSIEVELHHVRVGLIICVHEETSLRHS